MGNIQKRLRPLFIATFFSGTIFWYPIITPFMIHLGFDTAHVAYTAIVANAVILAAEVPSGILADRWSRKSLLLFGIAILGIGSFALGSAHNFWQYSLIFGFVSIYYAVHSGLGDAIIYDVLIEETGSRGGYERLLGRLQIFHSAGLVIGSLVGAVLAQAINFRLPFRLSFISCFIAFAIMLRLREPTLHRQDQTVHMAQHIKQLLRLVSQQRETRWLIGTSILVGILTEHMLSVDQLWPLALGLPLIWFGPLNAALLSSLGTGAALADWASRRSFRIYLAILALVVTSVGLTVHNIYVIAVSEVLLVASSTLLSVVLTGKIQDVLPASQRAGVGSLVSTMTIAASLPALLVFGKLAQHYTPFSAAWMLIGIAVLGGIGMVTTLSPKS